MNGKELTPEQKAGLKACRTPEELIQYADDNDIELPAEVLDGIAGGISQELNHKESCPAHDGGKHVYEATGEGPSNTEALAKASSATLIKSIV